MKSFSVISKKYGVFAVLVSNEDFDKVIQYQWFIVKKTNGFYLARNCWDNGCQSMQYLHRFLLGIIDPKVRVDHVDGNPLNNQRLNLRIATHPQNLQNRGKQKNNTSGYKGVTWSKTAKKWRAKIGFYGKIMHLGYFDTAEDASNVYETKAKELFNKFYKEEYNGKS